MNQNQQKIGKNRSLKNNKIKYASKFKTKTAKFLPRIKENGVK